MALPWRGGTLHRIYSNFLTYILTFLLLFSTELKADVIFQFTHEFPDSSALLSLALNEDGQDIVWIKHGKSAPWQPLLTDAINQVFYPAQNSHIDHGSLPAESRTHFRAVNGNFGYVELATAKHFYVIIPGKPLLKVPKPQALIKEKSWGYFNDGKLALVSVATENEARTYLVNAKDGNSVLLNYKFETYRVPHVNNDNLILGNVEIFHGINEFLTPVQVPVAANLSTDQLLTKSYPNGDAYFLIGDLDNSMTNEEVNRFEEVEPLFRENGFRLFIRRSTSTSELRAAVQNPRTTVIIWSGHGNQNGYIFDNRSSVIPTDIFTRNASPRLSLLVLSACYGECVTRRYPTPSFVEQIHWKGRTNTKSFFYFLNGERFYNLIKSSMNRNPRALSLLETNVPGSPWKIRFSEECRSLFQ